MWDFGIIPFWPIQNNQDLVKTKCVTGIRTRDVDTEGLDDLRYAIKSSDVAESNWYIIFVLDDWKRNLFYDLRQPGVI